MIQKHRLHHSNIYSGAPMPYMQRITWSGVALHAGVLPGYPASHGCIRMPMAFALKMWKWTKMGARVVVTPGELTPASFSHPLLAAQLSKPRPDAPPKTYSKKPPDTVIMAAVPEVRIELAEANSDSSGNPVTASDAGPSGRNWHQDSEIRNNPIDSPASPPSVVAEPAADTVVTEASKPHPFRSVEPPSGKPEGATKPAAEDNASGPDLKGPDPATSLPLAHLGQIAVLISGKDSKLYVRQNLAPVFEVPIVVARSERSLGTHVFTAEVDKKSANLVHWSVVSLPAPSPHWEPVAGSQVRSRPRRTVEPKRVIEAETPAEALDRITVPAEAMARITDALSTGGSFILSDQSINGGETGEGTDFIVSMR